MNRYEYMEFLNRINNDPIISEALELIEDLNYEIYNKDIIDFTEKIVEIVGKIYQQLQHNNKKEKKSLYCDEVVDMIKKDFERDVEQELINETIELIQNEISNCLEDKSEWNVVDAEKDGEYNIIPKYGKSLFEVNDELIKHCGAIIPPMGFDVSVKPDFSVETIYDPLDKKVCASVTWETKSADEIMKDLNDAITDIREKSLMTSLSLSNWLEMEFRKNMEEELLGLSLDKAEEKMIEITNKILEDENFGNLEHPSQMSEYQGSYFYSVFKENDDEYCYINITGQKHLEECLEDKGYVKYVDYKTSHKDVETRYPFFKKFRMFSDDDQHMYSYSIRKINDFFGKNVVESNARENSYFYNYIINLYYRENHNCD